MRKYFIVLAVLLLAMLSGCSYSAGTGTPQATTNPGADEANPTIGTLPGETGTPAGATGKLTVMVKDPPPPDMAHIWVDVSGLEVHKAGGNWTTIAVDMEPFDLKSIIDIPAFLADNIVEAGIYTQIRLEVVSVNIEVGSQEPYEVHEARIPSGNIKLVGAFEVREGEETQVTIDFNGEKSVNVTGNGQYMFKPVVKLLVPESARPSGENDQNDGNDEGDEAVQSLSPVLGQSGDSVAEIGEDPQDPDATAAHLATSGEPGSEARIGIDLPEGTTLGDIESVSWWVWTAGGYPPHLDIIMDHDGDGEVDAEDVLTAEMAYNNFTGSELDSTPPLEPALGEWLQTFELSSGDGYGDINNDTMLWVAGMGAGNDDAPWGTLGQWKSDPGGITNPPENGDVLSGNITHDAEVVRMEIEVDNWVLQSEAYVKGIEIVLDGTLYIVEF